jgi:BASS family bile acid:Na+ symporter
VFAEALQFAFKLSLIVFMVGNSSAMGLQLTLRNALRPLGNVRFLATTIIACFVFSPVVALAVTKLFPLNQPYTIGLLLLGFTPAAPFLPLVVRRARGDLAANAGFMLVASIGTIIVMPLAVPHVGGGLTTSAWAVARPLIFLILIPLAAGMAVRAGSSHLAERLHLYDMKITAIFTVVFLAVVLFLNVRALVGAIGSYAFAAQIVFVAALTLGGYVLSASLAWEQRIVVSLGTCTRNIGVAAAIVGVNGDQRIMAMLAIGAFVTMVFSFRVAAWFAQALDETRIVGQRPAINSKSI